MAHIPRALVVEDDARMRRIVAKVLTGCGIIVRAAGDGVEAMNAFRASREEPELVCADIRMPNMDGREFARRLRHEGVDVPIIFVSGTIPKDQEGYREKSHVYLVSKPFSPNDLANIVKEMLAKPRPRLGARSAAQPLISMADLSPLPSGPGATTPGFSPEDFPKKDKSASIVVPKAPDRPFGGGAHDAAPATPPVHEVPDPVPAPPPPPPGHRARKPHETTMIFLKPISAREVPKSGHSALGAIKEPAAKPAAPAVPAVAAAKPAAAAVSRQINVERRIREADAPGLRKPGQWVPRLIIWPESATPEAQQHWCNMVAAALGSVQTAGVLETFAFAPSPSPDAAGRRWRVKPGVRVDGQLFQAILSRKLRGLFLLVPKALPPNALDRFLGVEHLDRSNVLTLGALLVDFDCTSRDVRAEVTFLKEETAFLHALNQACTDSGCAMRRAEWKTK